MINFGASEVAALALGSTEVLAVYLGEDLVYSAGGGDPVEVSYQVTHGDDSGSAALFADWWAGAGSGEFIYWGDRNMQDLGFVLRFTGVAIPQGATITDARLHVTTANNQTAVTNVQRNEFGLVQADNASRISSIANFNSAWGNIGDTVDWYHASNPVNTEVTSPDLSDIVQDVIDRPGWASGNALAFVARLRGSANTALPFDPAMYSYESNEGTPSRIPRLDITYVE